MLRLLSAAERGLNATLAEARREMRESIIKDDLKILMEVLRWCRC